MLASEYHRTVQHYSETSSRKVLAEGGVTTTEPFVLELQTPQQKQNWFNVTELFQMFF